MNAGYKTAKSKLLVAVLTLLMVFGNVAAPLSGAFYVYGADTTVYTWTKLKAAVNGASDGDVITVRGDIAAKEQLVVNNNITIQGSGRILRNGANGADNNFSMFKVENGATLTLGEDLTISGKIADCKEADLTQYYNANIEVSVPGDAKPEKKTKENPDKKTLDDFAEKVSSATTGTLTGENCGGLGEYDFKPSFGSATTFEFDNGYIKTKINGEDHYLTSATPKGNYTFVHWDEANKKKHIRICEISSGKAVTELKDGEKYILFDEYWRSQYLTYTESGLYPDGTNVTGERFTFKAGSGSETTVWKIPDANGTMQTYTTKSDAEKALEEYNAREYPDTEYWVVPGEATPEYTSENDTDLVAAMKKYNDEHPKTEIKQGWVINGKNFFDKESALEALGPQGCEGEDCSTWTNSTFSSGSEESPKGFFVQVDNGALIINGATLSNFITDKSVKWAAPIVANGENSRVEIQKGKIQNNSVGYIIDNNANDSSKDAYAIRGIAGNKNTLTNTAGAVIYTNKATGKISGAEVKINNNRADCGAISVLKGADVEMTEGTISNNVGVHYGGAAYVYAGGNLTMAGGTMTGNYSWHRGGAVYVSDEEYGSTVWMKPESTKKVGASHFTLDGGHIDGNYSVNRGGAIYVESDGVALLSGSIDNNRCRSLGGAIYVAGDGVQRMYQLYISNACVTGNKAVKSASDLNYYLKDEAGNCEIKNELANDKGTLQGDNTDYKNYSGYGGGLWLCAFGGNATFGSDDNHKVIIDGNTAETKGQDIKLRPTRPGEGSAINFVGDTANTFYNENTDKPVIENPATDHKIFTGPLPLVNKREDQSCDGALSISNNIARVGGGIAANGTVVLGPAQDIHRLHAELKITKNWRGFSEEEMKDMKIKLNLFAQDEEGTYPLEGFEAELDGKEDEITENTVMWESPEWVLNIGLPISYKKNDVEYPVFTIKDNDEELSPINPAHLARIYSLLKDETVSVEDVEFKINLGVEETIGGKTPESLKYIFRADEIKLAEKKATTNGKKTYYAKDGKEVATVTTNVLELGFTQDVSNIKEKPEIAKFVNQAVHKPIALNEVFEYDVLAYVTEDADKVVITDNLVSDLEFASDVVTIMDLGTEVNFKPNNDASGAAITSNNGSVGITDGKTITGDGVNVDVDKKSNTLTVTLDNGVSLDENKKVVRAYDTITNLRGHWVKVTFKAKIAEGKTLEDLKYVEIKPDAEEDRDAPNVGNAPVESNEKHTGVPNKASYKISVGNDGTSIVEKYDDESNTVTVKPKEYPVKISKQALGDDTKELPGAEIKVTGPAGFEETWTSGEEPHELSLTPGEYELVEVVAPNGYNIATVTTTIKFTVDSDGNVKILGATEEYNGVDGDNGCKFEMLELDHLVLKDAPNPTVKISKTDLEGEEVEGATIELRDSEGNLVETWESTTEAHEVKLNPGRYEMKETVAPEGFNIVTTTIEFEVDHEGNVTLLTAEVDNGGKIELLDVDHIVLKDAPLTEVYFSKTDLEGEELEGAKMKLTDAEGNVIDEWTSTKEDHILKLADGEYILTEVVAPEGYQCVTTKMRFVVKEGVVTLLTAEVDNDGVIEVLAGNIIILKDAPEVQKEYEPKKPEEEKITPPTEEEKKLPPPEVKNVKKVDTGDNAAIYIWIAIMIIAACAVTFGAIKRRRTN